jgi:hypothetical protein
MLHYGIYIYDQIVVNLDGFVFDKNKQEKKIGSKTLVNSKKQNSVFLYHIFFYKVTLI